MLKLSHTQFTKFQQCGKSYELYYIKKLRPTQPKSSLLFGTAIDRGISAALEPSDSKKSPEAIFEYFWRFQKIGQNENVYLTNNPKILYGKRDFDVELISDTDFEKILEITKKSKEDLLSLMEKRLENGFASMTEEENKDCNVLFWFSMKSKGLYMLKAFKENVLPKLKKVHSTQEYVKLENGEGDQVIGYIDLVAELEGHDEPIVLDIKTSAMAYEEDAHLTAPQLIQYLHAVRDKYNTNKVGFIVLGKNILKNRNKICSKCGFDGSGGRHKTCSNTVDNKRCNGEWVETLNPSCTVQIMVGEVPKQTEDLVIENIDDITQSIKTGHFTRNLNTCFNSFGGLCEYVNYCYKGKTEGLDQL